MDLYTIGYEGLDVGRFVAHLRHHDIDVVADVRKVPISRKKGFSRTCLEEMLRNQSVEYLNFQELGAPQDIRNELHQSGNYGLFFAKYLKAIADNQDQLKAILRMIKQGKKVSLLCFERDPWHCHRKVVAEEIKKMDGDVLEIRHIVPD